MNTVGSTGVHGVVSIVCTYHVDEVEDEDVDIIDIKEVATVGACYIVLNTPSGEESDNSLTILE